MPQPTRMLALLIAFAGGLLFAPVLQRMTDQPAAAQTGCRTFADLPLNAQKYVEALEEMSGTRIWGVGVGPGREQTLTVPH